MCNRYHCPDEFKEIEITLRTLRNNVHRGRLYNIAPSDRAPVIVRKPGHDEVRLMTWGFASPGRPGELLRNARSETVHELRSYKGAFTSRRCLIPADGFFEWEVLGKERRPWRFARRDGHPFAMAGIWQVRINPARMDGTDEEQSYVMLTTEPNRVVQPIHDRMPAMLPPDTWESWLDPKTSQSDLRAILQPYDAALMRAHRVTTKMSNSRYKEADSIAEIPDEARQADLF